MTDLKTIEFFIAMDSDGDFAVAVDENDVVDTYQSDVGGNLALRVVKIVVTMRPPSTVEATVTVPDEAGQEVPVAAE